MLCFHLFLTIHVNSFSTEPRPDSSKICNFFDNLPCLPFSRKSHSWPRVDLMTHRLFDDSDCLMTHRLFTTRPTAPLQIVCMANLMVLHYMNAHSLQLLALHTYEELLMRNHKCSLLYVVFWVFVMKCENRELI